MENMKKPELLLPAGNLDNLKLAIRYGADAVYLGGQRFGLRARADNFSVAEMQEGVAFAHAHQAKVYLTVNIFAHNEDIEGIKAYFEEIRGIPFDALLISDPGVILLAKELLPDIPIHISTQANNTNYMTWEFWRRMGAERVVAARELSLAEIREIHHRVGDSMEIEAFVHGAMCISYSGRCLLSSYFTGRDANRGACTHPCRWKYRVYEKTSDMIEADAAVESDGSDGIVPDPDTQSILPEPEYAVAEDSRPGEYLPIEEDERGTYIFNSKDLCMIGHIPEMMDAGVASFKVEGRMKTALYVAVTARTYRMAVDDYMESPQRYIERLPEYEREIAMCTTRDFTTGFFFGKPTEEDQIYGNNTYQQLAVFLGEIEDVGEDGSILLHQKNKFSVGEEVEVMAFDGRNLKLTVTRIVNSEGEEQTSAPHPQQELKVYLSGDKVGDISEGMLLRRTAEYK